MFTTSLYWNKINLKKQKDLRGEQLFMYISSQYCSKISVKRTTQLLILYLCIGQYANFEICFHCFYLTNQQCMSAMILNKFTKDFWQKCLAIWVMYWNVLLIIIFVFKRERILLLCLYLNKYIKETSLCHCSEW